MRQIGKVATSRIYIVCQVVISIPASVLIAGYFFPYDRLWLKLAVAIAILVILTGITIMNIDMANYLRKRRLHED